MEKINLTEFIDAFSTIISYSIRHMTKEDWYEWSECQFAHDVFGDMQYYVLALGKCIEYRDLLEEYNMQENKRENIFLDTKK